MFSHIVTAAKSLFTRQTSTKSRPKPSLINSTTPVKKAMVTATRRRTLEVAQPITGSNVEVHIQTRSKRKSDTAAPAPSQTRDNKRRKRTSLRSNQEVESESQNETPEETTEMEVEAEPEPEPQPEAEPEPEEKPTTTGKTKHFRFDSEEPEVPLDTPVEESTEIPQNKEGSDDDSSDDEAPEAIDNSAQLSKIRSEAKKLEQAKQM